MRSQILEYDLHRFYSQPPGSLLSYLRGVDQSDGQRLGLLTSVGGNVKLGALGIVVPGFRGMLHEEH